MQIQEMYLLHKIISDIKYILLAFTFVLPNGIHAGNCDGERANQAITETPSNLLYVVEGSDASLTWAYCKVNESVITGFIIFLEFSPSNRMSKRYLISMNKTGSDVSKSENPAVKRKFSNRLALSKKHENITFVIKSTVFQDSGHYRLEIRRDGFADLYSRIKIRVNSNNAVPTNPTYKPTLPTITTIATKTRNSVAITTIGNTDATKEEILSTYIIVVSCIAAALAPVILFCFIYFVTNLIIHKRKKRKSTNTNMSSAETTPVNLQSQIETSANVTTISGASYMDSIEDNYDGSVPSSIDFPSNNTRPTLPVIRHLICTTSNIQQDSGCPLVPKRNNYEIKRELIKHLQIVGQGAFGLVAKADLYAETRSSKKRTIAVKMLKVFSSIEDKHDLISELNLMQGIDSHENVVELLGCVTETEPIWVITSYAARGDLLGFLRKSRGINDTTYRDLGKKPKTNLCPKQLLQMAKDIACGMTHLSQNKIIHRDLAARNVLVDENMKCKITDFGMARDVKSTNYYRIRNRGRIPLKWTAIEALLYDKYTIKSDVWSYGIVLYEIVTIGGSPYPKMGPREILRKLKNGWRMEKPCHVNDKIYDIMKDCWVYNADDRPSFSKLSRKFNTLLGARNHDYINMKEYNEVLHALIESTSESSSGSADEVAV